MTQEIQELLNEIYNEFDIEKFGLKKESRIFLDRLLLNNEYLKEFFELESDEYIFKFINIIYLDLVEIKNKINEIKEVAKNSREFEILFIKYFGHNLKNLEQEKKSKLKEFIEKEYNN